MSKDFTIEAYRNILKSLQKQAFSFLPFNEFCQSRVKHAICLRHDVDLLPFNSLEFAQMQSSLGIRGSYYFRAVKESWDEKVIEEISKLGHEVGYHYEDVARCGSAFAKASADKVRGAGYEFNTDSLYALVIESFEKNLEALRKIVPVSTICMHGSPMSKYDLKELWKYYDYREFGIEAEPYFDVDFSRVLYLTDTGRRWDGGNVSVRDKVNKAQGARREAQGGDRYADWKVKPPVNSSMNMTKEAIDFQNQYKFRSTYDIIQAVQEGKLPDKIMMTFHPQRWTDKPLPWMKELVWQNSKNVVKYFLIKIRQ